MSEQQQTLTIQQAMNLAVQHHNEARLSQAENICQQILESNPNHPVALHLLGIIAHQSGKHDVAVDLITKALAIKPEYAEAHNNLGITLHTLGKLDEAVTSYHKALDLKPDFAEANNNLGVSLKDLGKLEDAVASCRRALDFKPDYAEAHNNLGNALQDLGKLDDAVASCRRALDFKPDYAEAHYNLGNALKYLGQPDEAVTCYRTAINIKSDYAEAHNNLGVLLLDLGKLEDSQTSYQKALAVKPDYVEAHNNLSVVLRALGKLDDATTSIHKALAIMPNHTGALSNLGTILHEIGKFDDALKIFESVDAPVCSARVLECLFALGEYDKFYETQHASVEKYKTNIRAAAISAFASQQLKREDPHLFCKEPMNFIRVYDSLDVFEHSDAFRHDLINELRNKKTVWEPLGKTTKQGFQSLTSINLFDNPNGRLAEVNQIVKDTIEKYRLEFASEDCGFIKWFPNKLTFKAWFVRLLKKGHQTEHIHHAGWLSGVLYLQVPKFSDQEEGCIEFGLWGYDYPVLNKNYPRKRYYPKNGDIILFPSSLFHRTIPFHSNEERMSIAFDLIPT